MSIRRRRFRRDPVPVEARLGRYRGAAKGAAAGPLPALRTAWTQAAGAQGAANSVIVRHSRAGVVTVACASGAWAQELDARRDVLADRLRRAVPDVPVTGLRFVVGDHAIPAAPGAPARTRPPVRPSDDEIARAAEALRDVTDPELRDLLTRAAAGQAALARSKTKSLQRGKNTGRADRGG